MGIIGHLLLILGGAAFVIFGVPIVNFEMAIGFLEKDIITAIIIAVLAKVIGIFISFMIAKKS